MSIIHFSMVLTGPEGHTSGISVNDVTAYSVIFVWPDFLCVRIGNPIFGITYLPDFDPLRELSARCLLGMTHLSVACSLVQGTPSK